MALFHRSPTRKDFLAEGIQYLDDEFGYPHGLEISISLGFHMLILSYDSKKNGHPWLG
jgi:hypothetical protein